MDVYNGIRSEHIPPSGSSEAGKVFLGRGLVEIDPRYRAVGVGVVLEVWGFMKQVAGDKT